MPDSPIRRRKFVALLGLAAAGTLVVREWDTMMGFADGLQKFCTELTLPPDALREAYKSYLTSQNFSIPVARILAPHFNRHGSVQNSLPPRLLWPHIVPTLAVADRMARELGEKIHIISVYRSAEYNATCPGAAKASQHLRNAAMDIQFKSSPKAVASLAKKLRADGLFNGGIGTYDDFVHIDTRGHNADW